VTPEPARAAYEAARARRDHLIDHPDRTITVDAYRARIADAQHEMQKAYGKMIEARG
jgi:hypothetical protein